MLFRPLAAGELETFTHVAGGGEHAADARAYLERLESAGFSRRDWRFVLEEAHQIIGTLALWALPAIGKPSDFVLLELPWQRDNVLTLGTYFVRHALDAMQALGASGRIGYVVDQPPMKPQWQYFPEQRATLLTQLGFAMERATLRFEYEYHGDGAGTALSQRLTFRPLEDVGESAFIQAIEQCSAGTLDRRIRLDRERMGPAQQAKDIFDDLQALGTAPGWWQLAYDQDGALVGFVMPCTNNTVGYIGVLPHQRGHGYIDALLARLTATFAAAGVRTIQADTDVYNAPMARAFTRAGWKQIGTRHEYALDLVSRQP